MKIYPYEKLKKIYIVCAIIGAIIAIPVIFFASSIGLDGKSLVFFLFTTPLYYISFVLGFVAVIFNWKKILIGMIAPIPLVSGLMENFKGVFYAIKGLVALFKHQDLILNNNEANEE